MCRLELCKLFITKYEVIQKPLVVWGLNGEINLKEFYVEFFLSNKLFKEKTEIVPLDEKDCYYFKCSIP